MHFQTNSLPENFQQPVVVFRHHDAEADVFSVQALEGRAVPDHEPVFDTVFENLDGGKAFLLDFQKEEIGVCRINLIGWHFRQCLKQPFPFGQNQFSGF